MVTTAANSTHISITTIVTVKTNSYISENNISHESNNGDNEGVTQKGTVDGQSLASPGGLEGWPLNSFLQ